MPDDKQGQPADRVENETKGGRYGEAPRGEPHLSPEVAPARGNDPAVNLPASFAGALPENAGRKMSREMADELQNDEGEPRGPD